MFTSKSDKTIDFDISEVAEQPKKSVLAEIEVKHDNTTSVIGKGLTIVGNAYAEGEICIEGEFQGDIQCSSLKVGERAKVLGNLKAEDVIVSGQVEGTIFGDRVTLEGNSHITGDIHHESLAIAKGAVFHGKSYQAEADIEATGDAKAA